MFSYLLKAPFLYKITLYLYPNFPLCTRSSNAVSCCFGVVVFTVPGAQTLPDFIAHRIGKIFSQWNNTNAPGVAIGVVRNDSLIYAKGYGMADLESGIPITPATIFHMAFELLAFYKTILKRVIYTYNNRIFTDYL
jgi:hypothetical protein